MNGSSSTSNTIPISDEAFNLASLSKEANQDRQQIFTSLILPSPNLYPAALASQLESFITDLSTSPPPKGPSGYIWNRESPLIFLTKSDFVSLSFRVSDAIEDEWFITYILIQASKHFNGIVLNVKDQDGQFLLIEAADELPNWLTPDNAENRLWIYNGELHLIGPSIWSLTNTSLTEETAARLVRDPTKSTLASNQVSEAALARIKDYPLAASDNSQRSLVFLPNKVARVILSDPQLIAPISEAICTRDAISSRAFQRMIHFPPLQQTPDPNPNSGSTSSTQPQSSQTDELPTLVSIRLTKRIYAQLMAQRFYPPKIFGRRWQSNVENYRALMDSTTSVSEDELPTKEREERKRAREEGKWWDLGCKLSCGLEMLYSQEKALDSRRPRTVRPNESKDPRNSSTYESFLSSLSKMGYFGSEIQGSARWKQLESEAVEKWEALNAAQSKDEEESEKQSANAGITKRIDSILSASNASILPSIDPRQSLSILNELQDSDDWLTLSAEDLEEMLSSNAPDANGRVGNSEEDLEQQTAEQLKSFASKMEDFVNAQGDLEGARFNDEKSDDEDDDELDEDADSNGEKMNLDDEEEMEMDDEIMEEGDEKTKEKEEEEALRKAQKKLADLSTQEREAATSRLISSLKQDEWGAKNSESAKRAADMAKKMAAESLKETTSQSSRDRSNQMEMDVDQSRNEDEVDNEEKASQKVSSDTPASLRGLGGNQHFDGDSDEEESLDADDDTAEEKADRAAWLGLDDPNSNPTAPSNSSLASSIQGFGGRSDVPEAGADIGEDEEVEDSMQTEMDGFLEFSRRALGLSDEHYARILSERSARRAYIPSKPSPSNQPNVSNPNSSSKGFASRSTPLDIPEATKSPPPSRQKPAESSNQSSSSASNKGKAPSLNKSAPVSTLEERERARERADQTLAEAEESAHKRKEERRNMQQQQAPNPNINSFEQLMQAMENELGNERKNRQNGKSNGSQPPFNSSQSFDFTRSNASNTTSQKLPSKPTPRSFTQEQDSMVVDSDDSDSDLDELTAQDTELLKSLLSSDCKGSLASLSNVGGGVDANGNPNEDQINLISNFLESFKAQGGDAGPVGNLAKRMGVRLPRDDGK